jgi:hypothetical protein
MVGHADRRDDAVDREDQVQHQDLADRGGETWSGAPSALGILISVSGDTCW